MTAEIIAHAVVGFDPANPYLSPATLLVRVGQFAQAQITRRRGGGLLRLGRRGCRAVTGWCRTLARRLARFAWGKVEHDVMKVLYESVIEAQERHRLGEYYTPDWLAEQIVAARSSTTR